MPRVKYIYRKKAKKIRVYNVWKGMFTDMKSVIISLALAVVVLVISITYTKTIDNVSARMKEINTEIAIFLEKDEYNTAFEKTKELGGYIEEKRTLMEAIGNHEEIKAIEMGIVELREFIRSNDKVDALSKCAILDFLFGYLPESYHLKAENIL